MPKTAKKIIEIFAQTREKIDTLSLGDHDGWSLLGDELEDVTGHLPKYATSLLPVLNLCIDGFKKLAANSHHNSLALFESITTALMAAEYFLQKKPDRDLRISDALEALSDAIHPKPDQQVLEPEVTINDIATLLIQLEPDDRSGLSRLHELLDKIKVDESYPEAGRNCLLSASQKIKAMMKADKPIGLADLSEVGELIEEFMNGAQQFDGPPSEDSTCDVHSKENDRHQRTGKSSDSTSGSNGLNGADVSKGHENTAENDIVQLPEDIDTELMVEYIDESLDLIAKAEESLLTLEIDPKDTEAIGTVFRAFHTIKGTSAFLELILISELSHRAENLFSRVRDLEIRYSGGYADLSLRALDMIKELILSVQAALQGNPLVKPAGYDDLMEVLADPEVAGISEEFNDIPSLRVGDVLVARGKVERDSVEKAVAKHPKDKIGGAVIKSQAASVTDVGQALRTQQRLKGTAKVAESSVRVSTRRLDRLIDLMGELVIAHSMVAQDETVVKDGYRKLAKRIAHTSKIVRELQSISMSLRMVPLKATFNKIARLVRDLARKTGKKVDFIAEGEDTEIDRNLVDIINDPIVHMVRNAVDHGIEMPETRKNSGKPPTGSIRLSAYHAAGNVVVEIADDGQGLDQNAILAKAREKGLLSEGSRPSDSEVFNLIFEPGFSTAQTVTQVSGRGVGMDVVKKNIESLRGQVEIRSEPAMGSVFKMSLPLTLAIIDGMVVRIGSETYVIPTDSIIRSIKPAPGEIASVYQKGEMLTTQQELIPLLRLANLYSIDEARPDPNKTLVVVVKDEERMAGLLVDELTGRQTVVIKTLGGSIKDIPGISGATILPDGRVALILDVGGLLRLADVSDGRLEPLMTTASEGPTLIMQDGS